MSLAHMKVVKLAAVGTILLGGAVAFDRLQKINKTLGTQLIDQSEKIFLEEMQTQIKNQKVRGDSLRLWKLKIGVEMQIWEQRLTVWGNRLLYFSQYQDLNGALMREVVRPLLNNYEETGVFDKLDIIEDLRKEGQFNNKMTSTLMKVVQKNDKLLEEKSGYVQDVLQMQRKLMTVKLLQMPESSNTKVDVLYNYLTAKDLRLLQIAQTDQKQMQVLQSELAEIKQDDYLSKLHWI